MNYGDEINILNSGGIGVIPTDTLYGLVGRADKQDTIQRIYKTKGRSPDKPFIILISSINDLDKFNITISEKEKILLGKYWPGKVSIILKVDDENLYYLTRGSGGLAFRIPDKKDLQEILKETGPLVAPSANPEGRLPAKNIKDAKDYFGDKVDFYINRGDLVSEPSTLITIEDGEVRVLREGAAKI
jgi:L-threonylcarbamoyladenylate synthase